MLAPTHMLGGAAAALAVAPLIGAPAGLAAVAGALGALLPDLDTPQSKGARALPFAGATVVTVATVARGAPVRAATAHPRGAPGPAGGRGR